MTVCSLVIYQKDTFNNYVDKKGGGGRWLVKIPTYLQKVGIVQNVHNCPLDEGWGSKWGKRTWGIKWHEEHFGIVLGYRQVKK